MARDFDARSLELGRTYADGATTVLDVTNGTASTAYDNRGNPLAETVTGTIAAAATTSRAFAYDQRDRLAVQTGAGTDDAAWTLDKLGNWTSVTEAGVPESRSVSLDNEYTLVDGASVVHDANGNLTGWSGHQFAYDWADRLVRVDVGGATVASYVYDALGRRVARTAGGVTTRYVHSGSQVVEEYEDSGAGFSLARRYVLGPGLDQPILMEKVGGTGAGVYYYLRNRQGSVLALAAVDGSVAKSYRYSAYGKARLFGNDGTEIAVSALGNPYGYTGRRLDPESGLLYYRNRYYSPALGRFLSRDPAGQVDGLNVYAYVRGNPLAFVDPCGLSALPVWTPHVPPGAFVEHPCFGDDALRRYWSEEKALQGQTTGGGEELVGAAALRVAGTVAWQNAVDGVVHASYAFGAYVNANSMGLLEYTGIYQTPGPGSSQAAIDGARAGLQAALIQSALEAAAGAAAIAGGGTAAQGGAGLTLVSGGTGAAVGVPAVALGSTAAAGGALAVGHAGLVAATAYDNLQNLNAMKGNGGGGSAKGAGKSDPHGDGGRALQKAEKQIKDLEKELETATGKEAKKIKQKIENIRKTAQRKKRGETHWK